MVYAAYDGKTVCQSDTIEQRLAKTVYLVEANSFEKMTLWGECVDRKLYNKFQTWEQVGDGRNIELGKLGKRPVQLLVFWSLINGKLVGFWDVTSQVSDFKMVEKFFKKYCPSYTEGNYCDAMNFSHCINTVCGD